METDLKYMLKSKKPWKEKKKFGNKKIEELTQPETKLILYFSIWDYMFIIAELEKNDTKYRYLINGILIKVKWWIIL